MSGFVYLMKNGDLYKIGSTTDLKSEALKMKPGQIMSSFKTNDPKSFEVRLLRLYKKKRIPDTNYFRLSESEIKSCKKHLDGKTSIPKSINAELRVGLNGSIFFGVIAFVMSYLISKMFIFSLFLSILFASFPMWSIAIFGGFGGYDTDDLILFSTFPNRLKGFLIAISMISFSYVLYNFFHFSISF